MIELEIFLWLSVGGVEIPVAPEDKFLGAAALASSLELLAEMHSVEVASTDHYRMCCIF
jgi:hypothetical protein